MRILGIDPGLQHTGWGIIEHSGNRLVHLAHGIISTSPKAETSLRLKTLFDGLIEQIERWQPQQAAVEEVFVNSNAASSLKLGMARGVVMMAPAHLHIPVAEYTPNKIKKAVVGSGHAQKQQIEAMVKILLGGVEASADAADALAVAICHAHHR